MKNEGTRPSHPRPDAGRPRSRRWSGTQPPPRPRRIGPGSRGPVNPPHPPCARVEGGCSGSRNRAARARSPRPRAARSAGSVARSYGARECACHARPRYDTSVTPSRPAAAVPPSRGRRQNRICGRIRIRKSAVPLADVGDL